MRVACVVHVGADIALSMLKMLSPSQLNLSLPFFLITHSAHRSSHDYGGKIPEFCLIQVMQFGNLHRINV